MMDTIFSIGIGHYLTVSGLLFLIGALGVSLNRRHIIVLLMSIELMLLAVVLNFVAFSHFNGTITGQVFGMFILTVAAAESAIGLAIMVIAYRHRHSINTQDIAEMKG